MKNDKYLRQHNNLIFYNLEVMGKILIWVGLILLIITAGPSISGDGEVRFSVVSAIMEGASIPLIKYSLLQPLFSMPLAYISSVLGFDYKNVVAYSNIFFCLALGKIIFNSLIRIYSHKIAIHTLLLVLAASMFPFHLQQYYGEVLSTLCVTAGVLLSRKNVVYTVLLIGIGIANTPAIFPSGLIAALVLVRKNPGFLAGVVLALVLILTENFYKFGSLSGSVYLSESEKGFKTIMPYSGIPGFSYPLFFGILSVTLSFGKGLVFFIPGLFLLIHKKGWELIKGWNVYGVALSLFIIVLILVYSKWWAWYGGNFWGPRFFLILTIPTSLVLAKSIDGAISGYEKYILVLILLISFWVGINGVVFGQDNMGICWQNNYKCEMLCWYVPEFSALWRPFVTHSLLGLIDAICDDHRASYALWQFTTFGYFIYALLINGGRCQDDEEVYV